MAEQAEAAFVKTYLNTITNQPITYGNDYQQPLENSLKRVPVLPVSMHRPHDGACNWFTLMCRYLFRLHPSVNRSFLILQVRLIYRIFPQIADLIPHLLHSRLWLYNFNIQISETPSVIQPFCSTNRNDTIHKGSSRISTEGPTCKHSTPFVERQSSCR